MSDPTVFSAPDRDSRRSLRIPILSTSETAARRALRTLRSLVGLRAQIARAAHETLETLVGPPSRLAFSLASATASLSLERDQLAQSADASSDAAFELARGRAGIRVTRVGEDPVWRNGWLLPTGRPALLRDGDVVETSAERYVAAYERPQARPFVEIGAVGITSSPRVGHVEFPCAIEPHGLPLMLQCEPASARAILDVACGGDGTRPFDATVIGEVDRAVIEWVVARFCQTVSHALFDTEGSVRRTRETAAATELWFHSVARIGVHTGAWRIGTTHAAIEAAEAILAPRVRGVPPISPLRRRLVVEVVAHAPLGTVLVSDLAVLDVGDAFVSRLGVTRDGAGFSGNGLLTVVGSHGPPVRMFMTCSGSTVRARLVGLQVGRPDGEMGSDETIANTPFDGILDDLRLTVSIEVGRRRVALNELLALGVDDVLELDVPVQNVVTVLVDGTAFARGELVDVDGGFGVRITSIGGHR